MDNAEKAVFTKAVYDVVKTIPYGRATSYGAIAKAIGYPEYSRMVGHVMACCNSGINDIPAHRVVNSQGFLSGQAAFGHENEMCRLLEAEGIVVKDGRIQNWKRVFWNPMDEINIV